MNEHWLDRVAERQTRARFLKRVLAGAAVSLPLARAVPAQAQRRDNCVLGSVSEDRRQTAYRRGCLVTADDAYAKAMSTCNQYNPGIAGGKVNALATIFFLPVLGIAGASVYAIATRSSGYVGGQACADGALLRRKATQFDCLQPNTPGFDPCGPGGPCDTCFAPAICCPDPAVRSGFSCCTAPPEGCCKEDGCKSGITTCTG